MLYHVEMDVHIPPTWEDEKIQDFVKRERVSSQKWQKTGKWVYLWRVAGQYSNVSILNVDTPEEFHEIISSLPFFPYMTIRVKSLVKHPNSIKESII